jgi:two-component system chemotaxis response regulator CheB
MTERSLRLKIGEVVTSAQPSIIDTVILAPSVGVCIFSAEKLVGGMVQFDQSSSGKINGETLITALVQNLQKLTGQAANTFSAKLIGGAKSKKLPQSGEQSIKTARKTLAELKIKIIGEDIGGSSDRHALFHTSGGRLQVAALENSSHSQTESNEERKRKVLIVDDSKTIRDLLVRILSEDSQLEIIGTAVNPIEAQELLKTLKPDVITLDIHMPEMTGVEWLEKLLPKMSIPVVMITSLQLQDGGEVFKALELGAVDYIQKPVLNEIKEMAPVIREKVKSASFAKVKGRRPPSVAVSEIPLGTMDQNILIAIGASTGGTEALKDVLIKLPKDIPPIVIVQHIPAVFSKAFADRLNTLCPFEVLEAKDGDEVRAGRVLIAAGGTQMAIEKSRNGYVVRVTDDEPMNRHKPSVDFLFNSVAKIAGAKSLGVILTGMGADGAQGLLKMKQAGARTLGQDEESCVVYGMPRAAFLLGAVEEVHALDEMPMAIAKKGLKKKSVA